MLRGVHDLAIEPDQTSDDRRQHHGHAHHSIQHQHSAPASSSFRGRQSENGSFHSGESYQADTPRTSGSEPKIRRPSQDPSPRIPGLSALHEVAALRKHMKILEERLRNERHSHAVKFSDIEKQLIQENAKLKVSTSALQRQVRREQQLISDHEAELTKLKKEKKNRFSLSGITRSFSDVRLEDMEMKESSLKRKNTDSEVVRMIKERLDDSERDRTEAEALFSQRISTLLRERNLQRADMQIAEETVGKLTSENDALRRDMDELRQQTSETLEKSYQGDTIQLSLLKRANTQLQEELDHFHRERGKLMSELEEISEELALVKASERQNALHGSATGEMKNKIDSLRVKLSSLERRKMQDIDFEDGERAVSHSSLHSDNGPSTSAGHPVPAATYPQKVAELQTELKQKKRELIEVHGKLVNILELSQRYEHHCYNLEKELSKVYGKNYQYVSTNWRKKDTVLINTLQKVLKRSTDSQTDATSLAVVHSSPAKPRVASFFAATQTDASSAQDSAKLAEAKLEIHNLHKSLRAWEEKYRVLERQLHDLSEDEGAYDEPITQAEIDAKIQEARKRVAEMESAGVIRPEPVLAASNPFAAMEKHTPNYTAPSSGIWTSWSSGSSNSVDQPRLASEY